MIVQWVGELTMDADEITVLANSEDSAIKKATKKWHSEFGARWPDCRPERVFVLKPKQFAESS